MIEVQREVPTFSHPVDSMLALVIQRLTHGEATANEVTAVLRRVCDESRTRRPELLLLRIKALWTKAAGAPRAARDDRDRRYHRFIGEALTLYFESSPAPVAGPSAAKALPHRSGEPEVLSAR